MKYNVLKGGVPHRLWYIRAVATRSEVVWLNSSVEEMHAKHAAICRGVWDMKLSCGTFDRYSMTRHHLLPHARMREAGLSNRFCPSVSRLSVCHPEKIEISPHRPSKTIQMESNNSK